MDGQVHANSAWVLVEGQALQYEWDTILQPSHETYCIKMDARPLGDISYWDTVVDVAHQLSLGRVEEASDTVRQWFVGDASRLLLEPYYGSRTFSEEVPVRWGVLYSTSVREGEAFHARLRDIAGWQMLEWRPVAREHTHRPADHWWTPDF